MSDITTYDIARRIADDLIATGYATADLQRSGDGWWLDVTTGGWSNAEEILSNLHDRESDPQRWMWRILTWRTVERGGRFTFADDGCRVIPEMGTSKAEDDVDENFVTHAAYLVAEASKRGLGDVGVGKSYRDTESGPEVIPGKYELEVDGRPVVDGSWLDLYAYVWEQGR